MSRGRNARTSIVNPVPGEYGMSSLTVIVLTVVRVRPI